MLFPPLCPQRGGGTSFENAEGWASALLAVCVSVCVIGRGRLIMNTLPVFLCALYIFHLFFIFGCHLCVCLYVSTVTPNRSSTRSVPSFTSLKRKASQKTAFTSVHSSSLIVAERASPLHYLTASYTLDPQCLQQHRCVQRYFVGAIQMDRQIHFFSRCINNHPKLKYDDLMQVGLLFVCQCKSKVLNR